MTSTNPFVCARSTIPLDYRASAFRWHFYSTGKVTTTPFEWQKCCTYAQTRSYLLGVDMKQVVPLCWRDSSSFSSLANDVDRRCRRISLLHTQFHLSFFSSFFFSFSLPTLQFKWRHHARTTRPREGWSIGHRPDYRREV